MYLIDTRKYDDSFLLAKILEKVDITDEEKKKLFKHFEKPEVVDAVPMVLCKDCKWGDITDYGAGEVLKCIRDRLYRTNSISLEGETYFRKVEPGDFCSWGERKDE